MNLELHLKLESDTTFGRGDGIAGLVDAEVEHETKTGLPYLRGRSLKGLLVEECANILYTLQHSQNAAGDALNKAAHFLFGRSGSGLDDDAHMQVGAAMLPKVLRQSIVADIEAERLRADDVLESLTAIRVQTSIDEETGAPEEGSLRAMRVILRETSFIAPLDFDAEPDENVLALLSACVIALHRAGTGRNRGRGRLTASLFQNGKDITVDNFDYFETLIGGEPQ